MEATIVAALIAGVAAVLAALVTVVLRPRRLHHINDPETLIRTLMRERDECRAALDALRGP